MKLDESSREEVCAIVAYLEFKLATAGVDVGDGPGDPACLEVGDDRLYRGGRSPVVYEPAHGDVERAENGACNKDENPSSSHVLRLSAGLVVIVHLIVFLDIESAV